VKFEPNLMTDKPGSANADYRFFISSELREHSIAISDEWLTALQNVVNEDSRDIFPTEQYLDHIPTMIDEIAAIVGSNEEDLGMVNSLIERKAIQLGTLRHQQKASVSQLLREYDLLAEILEQFLLQKTSEYKAGGGLADGIEIMASVARVVRSILQSTVDTFVEKYIATIQEQTEKILAFNEFLSHELKTPLQAALLNTELLIEDRDLTNDDTKALLTIATSVQQASSLLQKIEGLTLNTAMVVEDSPVVQLIDVSALVHDIQSQLEATLDTRDVKMLIEEGMGEVIADMAKLKLIFTNILTNSLKYCDPAKDQRTVSVSVASSDESSLSIIVRDNGIGIEKSMQEKVFQMRVRAHETNDDRNDVNGYGLGLYLVSEAVRDIGGMVTLESNSGVGTAVTVTIPTKPSGS
jgi:signal transduction histidine kinase